MTLYEERKLDGVLHISHGQSKMVYEQIISVKCNGVVCHRGLAALEYDLDVTMPPAAVPARAASPAHGRMALPAPHRDDDGDGGGDDFVAELEEALFDGVDDAWYTDDEAVTDLSDVPPPVPVPCTLVASPADEPPAPPPGELPPEPPPPPPPADFAAAAAHAHAPPGTNSFRWGPFSISIIYRAGMYCAIGGNCNRHVNPTDRASVRCKTSINMNEEFTENICIRKIKRWLLKGLELENEMSEAFVLAQREVNLMQNKARTMALLSHAELDDMRAALGH